MNMKRISQAFFAVFITAVAVSVITACDMTYVSRSESREISQDERDELERNGHFLKLTYMPVNTQVSNVASVSVANSVSAIARLDQNDKVRVFKETDADASTVYLPLAYNDGSDFTETGNFYVAFAVHVDAITSFIVTLDEKIAVPFAEGRGELDVRTRRPVELTEMERDELERTGRFLKLTYMPVNTQITNVSSAQAANSVSAIARLNQKDPVRVFRDTDANSAAATAYLPLVYNDDSEFTETGSFYVAFTVHVDALISYVIILTDKIVVPFTDGRGELDVRTLPVSGPGPESAPDLTENERDELERTGRFLKLTYMPLHTQGANVASVQIANSVSSVATLDKNQGVRIFRDSDSAAVYLPLVYFDNSEFTDNGSFYAAFAVHVDAITSYVVTVTDKILVPFTDGRGELDVRTLPYGGVVAADRRYLTVYNLPLHLLAQNVSNVFINNRYGPVAHCGDYSLVGVSTFGGSATVSIPLSFVNSPNAAFSGTGSFYVAFTIDVDTLTHYTAAAEDRVLVYFLNGNGYLDINDLPGALAAERRYLTITGLPSSLLAQNVSNVMVRNQAGPVAQCVDYNLLEVSVSGGNASVRIPLAFINPPSMFTGTGSFIVTFNINIDANTSYIVTAADNVQASFADGNGAFDVAKIPAAPPPDRRFLTITGLPSNLIAQNVSNVILRNQAGPVAQCEDYSLLEVSLSGGRASVRIPLAFINPPSMFTGTGNFIVTFNINIDAETAYIVTAADNVQASFTNGNGAFDVAKIPAAPPADHRYLTITRLPPSLLAQNVSNVTVRNQAGPVAQCENYGLITVSLSGGEASARIPLFFINPPSMFTGTGNFIVTFNINIDAETAYIVTADDNAPVSFTNGNGSFDINKIPKKIVPCLTIKNLPANTAKHHISGVSVYSLAGVVATGIQGGIDAEPVGGKVTALIPLSSSSGDGYFQDTGRFAIAFSVITDIETRILISREHNIYLDFIKGSADFDVESTYGYFAAELTNPSDDAKPVIKAGAEFDIDGYRYKTAANVAVSAEPVTDKAGDFIYLYASHYGTDVFFEFLAETPSFNSAKNGYYNGTSGGGYKRALWIMVYLKEEKKYLFKTPMGENFPQFHHAVLNDNAFTALTTGKTKPQPDLSGASNPSANTFTLQPGVYAVKLIGAGGGGGYGAVTLPASENDSPTVSGSSSGGAGGSILEIFTLNAATTFTAFTGSGGYAAPAPDPSGKFKLYGYKNTITANESGGGVSATTAVVGPFDISPAGSGGGGGGGGAGTFLYASQGSQGYFLCAGGGSGGSGGSSFTPGGAGGAGGVIGPGAGGGAAGFLRESYSSTVHMTATGGNGGKGGGSGGGSGGLCTPSTAGNGGTPYASLLYAGSISGGSGAPSYAASAFSGFPSSCFATFMTTGHTSSIFNYPIISVIPLTYDISASSGNGGSTPMAMYEETSPEGWRNTNGAGAAGARSPALNALSFSGTVSASISANNNAGQNSSTYTVGTCSSTVAMKSEPKAGINGSPGGNNRNSTKGGGAAGGTVNDSLPSDGSPGSIIIYKIY